MFGFGNVRDRIVQIAHGFLHGRLVFDVEGEQLLQDVAAFAQARMTKDLPARDHLEGDAAKACGDADMIFAWILAEDLPVVGQVAEVCVAQHQIVGDAENGGAQGAVGAARQMAGMVDAIALMPGGEQSRSSGDGTRVGVVFDGSHFAGEVGGRDHVDARTGQQKDVGRLGEAMGAIAFQRGDFQAFSVMIVVVGEGDLAVQLGGDIGSGSGLGPGEDGVESALLESDFLLIKELTGSV